MKTRCGGTGQDGTEARRTASGWWEAKCSVCGVWCDCRQNGSVLSHYVSATVRLVPGQYESFSDADSGL